MYEYGLGKWRWLMRAHQRPSNFTFHQTCICMTNRGIISRKLSLRKATSNGPRTEVNHERIGSEKDVNYGPRGLIVFFKTQKAAFNLFCIAFWSRWCGACFIRRVSGECRTPKLSDVLIFAACQELWKSLGTFQCLMEKVCEFMRHQADVTMKEKKFSAL